LGSIAAWASEGTEGTLGRETPSRGDNVYQNFAAVSGKSEEESRVMPSPGADGDGKGRGRET
jgi:hypothetical protein